jgi:hypothetical protein
MPYDKFKSIMEKVLVPGDDLKEECSKPYVPNPDPADVQLEYFANNIFLQ